MLLSGYNAGRKKTLFCVAVNLLELQELQEVLREIDNRPDIKMLTLKEKSAFVAGFLVQSAGISVHIPVCMITYASLPPRYL